MKYKEVLNELDKLGDDWGKYKDCCEGDATGYKKRNEIWIKIIELVYELKWKFVRYEEYIDIIHTFLTDEIKTFNSTYTLSSFITTRITNRMKTALGKRLKEEDNVFLDDNVEQDGKAISKHDLVEDNKSEMKTIDDKKYYEFQIVGLIAMFANLQDRLKGRENNESKRKHYKNFYTDQIYFLILDTEAIHLYIDNEAEIIRAINFKFMDFFAVEKCRSVKEIHKSHLKKYSDMVDGKGKELPEHKIFFPGDVYVNYYYKIENENISDSAISQQKEAYRNFIKNNLVLLN